MAAEFHTENIKSDKWLSGLVDAMEDLSAAESICREANPVIVARLFEQLRSRQPTSGNRRKLPRLS